jgi:hypothetical protein
VENFVELSRLYREVGWVPGPEGWSVEARDAVRGRLDEILAVWLDEPLSSAGFRRSSDKWVLGKDAVRPIVDVQRKKTFKFEGVVEFTINWGVWVEPFARQIGRAKRPAPMTSTAPFAARIGDLLPAKEDVWWAVLSNGFIRTSPTPRLEGEPTPDDDVPRILRNRLIPMLQPIDTVSAAIAAIESWVALGLTPSTIHIAVDPLVTLRRFVEGTEAKQG